jgi:hypothetical protein
VCSDSSQPRVECWGSSQPRVECWDSSQPRVVCWGSSQPRVECWDSSQPRVECWDSSQPRVEAAGHAQVATNGPVPIAVATGADVTISAEDVSRITGAPAHLTKREPLTSVEQWCQEYGVRITDGVVTLFKAVRDDYKSANGGVYVPGTTPIAADWDGGRDECGRGLHFCPRPVMALGFDRDATKFIACPVAVTDIRPPHPTDGYRNKVKAKGCCGPVVECDLDGEPLPAATVASV